MMSTRTLGVVAAVAVGGIAVALMIVPSPARPLSGMVTSDEVIVRAQVAGRIRSFAVGESDAVRQGDLLATIDAAEALAQADYHDQTVHSVDADVRQAEALIRVQASENAGNLRHQEALLSSAEAEVREVDATLRNNIVDLERAERLWQHGLLPRQQLDLQQAATTALRVRMERLRSDVAAQQAAVDLARAASEQVEVRRARLEAERYRASGARAEREIARLRATYRDVTAPIDGVVNLRISRAGEVVTEGQPLMSIVDPRNLWIRIDVEESLVDRLPLGAAVDVHLPSGRTLPGRVTYRAVDAAFATQRDVGRDRVEIQTFEVRIKVDNRPGGLALGMTAFVTAPQSSGSR
jgi:HlyD family secretion protein